MLTRVMPPPGVGSAAGMPPAPVVPSRAPRATATVRIGPVPAPSDDPSTVVDRSADARLARSHLRGGLLPLARAALEQMAGAGTLDAPAMADLAEARWRNGDTEGAGEAARAHQASGGDEPIAALIIAEDMVRTGHVDEAGRVARSLYERVGGAVDIMFAGQPRTRVWTAPDDGWMDVAASDTGRWGLLVGGSEVAVATADTWQLAPIERPADAAGSATPSDAPVLPQGRGGIDRPGGQTSTAAAVMSGRLAGEELEYVDRSLAVGDLRTAADRLSVLLRLDPALAPVILSAADGAVAAVPSSSPGLSALHLVRGDAYRILGRDTEAATAYQQAHQALAPGATSEGTS